MPGSFQLFADGSAADPALQQALSSIEVEESAEEPGAMRLHLPVSATDDGDLTFVNDAALAPHANLAIVVTAGEQTECIFDGYVLSQKLRVTRGTVGATLEVWCQDASWLMNLEEKTREWANVTDATAADTIFGEYGFSAAAENGDDDSPSHTDTGHTLMQRGTDIQFLRQLARRNGKLCRVRSGAAAGDLTGYFARPAVDGDAAVALAINSATTDTVGPLDFEWDVTAPTQASARQALFNDEAADGVGYDAADSGLAAMEALDMPTFAAKAVTALVTSVADDVGELRLRAQSVLREGGFFVRGTGEADAGVLGAVLRVGDLVSVAGAGAVFSGKYLVWSVQHALTTETHRMRFTLVRNAVGQASGGIGGAL